MTKQTVPHHHTNGKAPSSPAYQVQSDYEAVQPKPATPGWKNHEPPFLHSVKWHDPESGIEHLTVIRADDLDSLFVQVRTVTHMVKMVRQKAQDTPGEREAPEGWCDIHNVQMTRSKDGKGYYHKAGVKADGKAAWCRGK